MLLGTRDQKLVTIQIWKDISGKAPSKFIAKQTTDFGDVSNPKKEYVGKGESEDQELQDCIRNWGDFDVEDSSKHEIRGRIKLLKLCKELSENYYEIEELEKSLANKE